MSSHGICNWHSSGSPTRFQGEPNKWRWYVPGCPKCVAKWKDRVVTPDVLTPEQLIAEDKAKRPWGSVDRQRKEAAGRREWYWTRPATRVA